MHTGPRCFWGLFASSERCRTMRVWGLGIAGLGQGAEGLGFRGQGGREGGLSSGRYEKMFWV